MADWLPEEAIIPNLPNDIALLCLARVPRQYHPILAAVSKPIRFVVSSPQFFAARSRLGSSEKALYLRIRSNFDSSGEMFAVHRDPGDDGPVRVAPIPPLPVDRLDGSASAVLGHSIYVIGGWILGDPYTSVVSTRRVWVLDCRTNTWSRGPDMLVPRSCSAFATVLGGKIYVFGGTSWSADPFGEVFSPTSGRWDVVPGPPAKLVSNRGVTESVVLGNKIFVWVPPFELRFDAATQTWETGKASKEERRFLSHMCVVDERLYAYHHLARRIMRRGEIGDREWKEAEGALKWLPQRQWNNSKMVTAGRRLVFMAGQGESLALFSRDSRVEVSKKKRFGTWFTSVKVGENVGGASSRAARWSEEVFFPQKSGAPEGSPRYDPGFAFLDWDCFLVSL